MRRTLYGYRRAFKGGERLGILLKLETAQGKVGWGEIAPLPGFSQESYDEALEDLLEGKESNLPSVRWGQAAAMLDLVSPLDVESIPIRTLEQEKIKVGHLSLNEAIQKTEKAECSGVDMNRSWSLEEALAFAGHFPHLDYFEEPLEEGEDATKFPYPVALDESLRERTVPPYPTVKAHVIKPMLHGYPLPKKTKGVDFILSSSYESELGIHQIAKLAYRLEIPLKPMGLGTTRLFEEPLFEETLHIKEGRLSFPKTWTLKMDKVQVLADECL